jgi:lipopolysaccharide export LptBFGC system permease protein LptF
MKRFSPTIAIYIIRNVIPYFVYSWLILSVILFVQQASRYSDIFFGINIPGSVVWQLALALLPNVIAFTSPMAILLGVIIGLSKMQGDNETAAIRAAGVSNTAIILPIAMLGIFASGFAVLVNLEGVPLAASAVRRVALQSAIKKLESPFEPGEFSSEIPGYTFYMRRGDVETGRWNDIFVFNEDRKTGEMRIITSAVGRIDSSDSATELVLEEAKVATAPGTGAAGKYVSENLGEIRFALPTGRAELVKRLSGAEPAIEELGLAELTEAADSLEGTERTEALILRQRKLILSISPFIFCLLGAGIVLRLNRGSRGFAIFTGLIVLIGFYLLTFMGEQLARTGTISVVAGALIPFAGSAVAGLWLAMTHSGGMVDRAVRSIAASVSRISTSSRKLGAVDYFADITTGLRDLDITLTIVRLFLLTLSFFISIFVVFTAFELWKFAGSFAGGPRLLGQYLVYLLPFVWLQIGPSALMIAVLAAYLIKSRNNEIVTWTSAGQSVYRLILPCIVIAVALGLLNFGIQELLLPQANRAQDSTRLLIRARGKQPDTPARTWIAEGDHIFAFINEAVISDVEHLNGVAPGNLVRCASDNDIAQVSVGRGDTIGSVSEAGTSVRGGRPGGIGKIDEDLSARSMTPVQSPEPDIRRDVRKTVDTNIKNGTNASASDNEIAGDSDYSGVESVPRAGILVFKFVDRPAVLQSAYRSASGRWSNGELILDTPIEVINAETREMAVRGSETRAFAMSRDPKGSVDGKISHLTTRQLRVDQVVRQGERSAQIETEIERRYSNIFLPLVMVLFAVPFAISLTRRGKVAMAGYAVAIWLVFIGISNALYQLAINGSLSPQVAVWAPLLIFASIGVFLIGRIRT